MPSANFPMPRGHSRAKRHRQATSTAYNILEPTHFRLRSVAREVVTRDGNQPGCDSSPREPRRWPVTHPILRSPPAGPMAVTRTTANETIRARKKRGTGSGPEPKDSLDSPEDASRFPDKFSPNFAQHQRVLQLATPCGPRFVLMLARPSRTLTLY